MCRDQPLSPSTFKSFNLLLVVYRSEGEVRHIIEANPLHSRRQFEQTAVVTEDSRSSSTEIQCPICTASVEVSAVRLAYITSFSESASPCEY